MTSLSHNEQTTSIFRPRHPIVCYIDIVGVAIVLFFLSWNKSVAVNLYLLSVLVMYFFSILHHWLPHAEWRQKIDHMMIFIVITMTMMPYWTGPLVFEWAPLGPIIILGVMIIGVTIKWFSIMPARLSALMYVAAALPGIVDFLWSWYLLPTPWNVLWVIGLFLYAAQLLIYTFRWVDLKPSLFGFRETQHCLLLLAITSHVAVAINI